MAEIDRQYAEKIALVGQDAFNSFERNVLLHSIDSNWREHLAAMDYLRQGIHLRGYAQKNPKQEYKREAFEMFRNLWNTVQHQSSALLVSVEIRQDDDVEQAAADMLPEHTEAEAIHPDAKEYSPYTPEALAAAGKVVHRNDPCPCGSGLKYKQCHGKLS